MKIKNVFNLESLARLQKSGDKAGFKDAAAGVVLERQLVAIDPKIYEKKFSGLAFMSSGIEMDNTGGYANKIESLRTEIQGDHALASDQSEESGKITIFGEASDIQVVEKLGHSVWTDSQIKQAELAGRNLPQLFIAGHNELYQRAMDYSGYLGTKGTAGKGLLNNSLFASSVAPQAAVDMTGQELYDAISGLVVDQHNEVIDIPEYMASRVDMAVSVFNLANKVILNSNASTKTVLASLRENHPEVMFRKTAKAEDVAGNKVAVAYSVDPQAMVFRNPVPLEFSEVDVRGFTFKVDSKYRIAGLDILEPKAGRILTGL